MTNEEKIWNLLMQRIQNPYGVAAIMGNLRAESSLSPLCMTGKNAKQWKSKQEYVDAVNNYTYDRYSFAHDSIAFGLVQWCFYTRKEALFDYAEGMDIGSVEVQIGYLIKEMSEKYKTVWEGVCNAKNIATPCDLVMLKYEKPGTVTEAAKQKRRDFATTYFDKYYKPEPQPTSKYVRTIIQSVVVRCGNGPKYSAIDKILEEGSKYPWVATSENNWHAIEIMNRVAWVSGNFTEIIEE